MPNRDDHLREFTFPDQEDLGKRVFYTLTDQAPLTATRTAKAVAILVKTLSERKLLTQEQIDDFLIEVTT